MNGGRHDQGNSRRRCAAQWHEGWGRASRKWDWGVVWVGGGTVGAILEGHGRCISDGGCCER